MWRRAHEEEQGAALVFALLAVIMLGGLAVTFAARSLAESRLTGSERDYETAIHIAEAGIDNLIGTQLNSDDNYVTTTPAAVAHVYDTTAISLTADPATQRAWALAIADDATKCAVVTLSRGQACAIRPQTQDGTLLPWIFGVGFSPSRDAPAGIRKVRVVKVQFDKGFFAPEKAVLTNGSLTIGGSLIISGNAGAVHTNSELTVVGTSVTTTGPVTSTGTFGANASDFPAGSGPVDYTEVVPQISAYEVYQGGDGSTPAQDNAAKWDASTLTYGTTLNPGVWFDLCPDGKARVPAFNGDGTPARCTGPILYDRDAAGAPSSFRGWSLVNDSWTAGGGSDLLDGIYYVYQKNVRVSGRTGSSTTPARVTILADSKGTIVPGARPDTGTGCSYAGDESGSITISGTGSTDSINFDPYIQDLLLLADRDINIAGNASTIVRGFISAHEQADVTGTPNIAGAVFTEDACDTVSSPVHSNRVSGNFTLLHNGDLNLPLPSVVRITAWNEY